MFVKGHHAIRIFAQVWTAWKRQRSYKELQEKRVEVHTGGAIEDMCFFFPLKFYIFNSELLTILSEF